MENCSSLRTVEAVETAKLNPYGFIYIPKNTLASLPFKTGDRLHLMIDKVNKRVVITPSNKTEDKKEG